MRPGDRLRRRLTQALCAFPTLENSESMSLSKPKTTKRKIKNVKARREIKKRRAKKHLWSEIGQNLWDLSYRKKIVILEELVGESEKYQEVYNELLYRKENEIPAVKAGDLGNKDRIRDYSLVLRQTLLHRSIKLFEGAIDSLLLKNGYMMSLSIRGLFETTAAIGYLHCRLESYKNKNITAEKIDSDITTQLLGTRDKIILEKNDSKAVEAKQIMTMLEYADKTVSRSIMGGNSKDHEILTDIYSWLCEYCHPNFHSNSLAFKLDSDNFMFTFKHDTNLRTSYQQEIKNILIATPIFIALFDNITNLIPAHTNRT